MNDWSNERDSTQPQRNFFVRWFIRLGRWLRNFLAFIGFSCVAMPILLLWFVFHSGSAQKHPKTSSSEKRQPFSLWISLDGAIAEHEPNMSDTLFREFFGRESGIYLPTLRAALRDAASDKLVRDIQIIVDGLSGSPADVEELREIILDFKSSGKPVISWVSHMDNAALLISSATDKIHLYPVSEVSLPGPAFPMTYFGDALKKIGVEMQVVKTGKFKSAFEPFVSNEPSAESREALGSVERSLRDQMVKHVAQGRKKQDSEVFLWFKESFFTPAKAKELGIVDELAYIPYVNFDGPNDKLIDDYAADESFSKRLGKGYSLNPEEGLGLIEAVGEIVDSADGDRKITPEVLDEELNWALHDENVKALVLRISSPGGSAAASDYIWNRIRAVNEKKPVIVSMGSVAASGGYYLASGGRKIFCDPSTITGSIGVIGMLPNLDGLKEKWGVSFHTISQTNRVAVVGGHKMTPQDQSYMQATVEDVYRTFKSRVAENRKMTMERVEELAQGRVYTGVQAKQNGLIDEIGSLKDAMQFAKKEAGLDETKLYPIHRYEPSEFSLNDCLTSISKLKKCFKHHGSHVKTNIMSQALGEDYLHWKDGVRVKDSIKRRQTLMVLPIEAKI